MKNGCYNRTMILNTLQRKLKNFLQDCEIELLEWPPQSADLNPIENLWSLLDAEIPLGKRYNKTVFLNDLQLKFQQTDTNYLRKLVTSFLRKACHDD